MVYVFGILSWALSILLAFIVGVAWGRMYEKGEL